MPSNKYKFSRHKKISHKQKNSLVSDLTFQKINMFEMLDMLPDAAFIVNRKGRVVAWNHALEILTGVESKEVLGKGDYEYSRAFYGAKRPIVVDVCLSPEIKIQDKYHFLRKESDSIFAVATIPRLKGREVCIWIKASPLYDKRGKMIGAMELVRDITQFKKAMDIKRKFAEHVTLIREEETKIIAANLHDEVGAMAIVSNCGLRIIEEEIKKKNTKASIGHIRKLRAAMEERVAILRNIARDLRPIALEKFGLLEALRKYFSRIAEQTGLNIDFTFKLKKRGLPKSYEAVLYRVSQEALNNTVRHARARNVRVSLFVDKKLLKLQIIDDGKGISLKKSTEKGMEMTKKGVHMGIQIMRERVELLNGEFVIRSIPLKGTEIYIELPLQEESEKWL